MDYVTERLAVEYGPGGLSVDYVTIRDCLWIMLLQGTVCGLCYYKGLSVDYVTTRGCLWIMLLRDWL